jgi:hypothetical protein
MAPRCVYDELTLVKYLGQHINCMWRVRAKLTDPSSNQRVLAANEKKHVTWYATLDGALGKFCRKQFMPLMRRSTSRGTPH